MNEKLYKICEDIMDDEAAVSKFDSMQSIDEMYEYFHAKVPELSEEEFEDFIVDAFEMGELPKEASGQLSDDDLSAVAGGTGFGAKVAAVGISLASLLPSVGATNQPSVNESSSANTSISQTIDKKEVKSSQKSRKVGNFITRTFAKCVNKLDEIDDISSALMKAVDRKKVNEKWVRLLLENGADINYRNFMYDSALFKAVLRENKKIVKLLLDYGADANTKVWKKSNGTVLMMAVRMGNADIVKLLLDAKANVNIRDNNGWTAFMCAVENNEKEIAEMLIEKSADVNIKNNNGWSALMLAVEKGEQEVAKMLVEKSADVNIKNNNGQNALMMAVEKGDLDTVDLLLEHGAKVNSCNHNDKTALDIAEDQPQSKKMDTIIKMLKEKGAKTYEELNLD